MSAKHSHLYHTPDQPTSTIHLTTCICKNRSNLRHHLKYSFFIPTEENRTYTICKYEKHIMRNKCFKYPSFHSRVWCMEMYVFCRCAWRWCTGGLADDGLAIYLLLPTLFRTMWRMNRSFCNENQATSQGSPVCLFININFRHIYTTKYKHNINELG